MAAVSVLAVVTVIIFVFGVIPLPEFSSLADQPDPSIPGTVPYHDWVTSETERPAAAVYSLLTRHTRRRRVEPGGPPWHTPTTST